MKVMKKHVAICSGCAAFVDFVLGGGHFENDPPPSQNRVKQSDVNGILCTKKTQHTTVTDVGKNKTSELQILVDK